MLLMLTLIHTIFLQLTISVLSTDKIQDKQVTFNGPKACIEQTIWYIEKIDQRYMSGYTWKVIEDEPINTSPFIAYITPSGKTHFYFGTSYITESIGEYDHINDQFMMETSNTHTGRIVHWSYMKKQTDLN
eukprot:261320_1